ncbi:MAG: hypothetical protein MK132_00140 [Lentisphaerales bacterium]|nr:hypothetical protein [Lentisphaerales bacterium]
MKIFVLALIVLLTSCQSHGVKAFPSLFLDKGKLYFSEEFNGDKLPKVFEARSGSTTSTKNSILTVVNNDKKNGARPVIHCNKIPQESVCNMRIKMTGGSYTPKNPWLDVGGGHRNHFRFKEDMVLFSSEDKPLEKRKINNKRHGNMLPLNEWLNVTIEIKKGKIGLSINGKTEVYEGANIETGDRLKIAMKAIPKGKLLIDLIRIWEISE